LTFNYVKAFSDWMNNFTFGKGVNFKTPEATSSIVPPLLRRVWHQDNKAKKILWEIGNLGGVSGDVFIKVAYEPAYLDPIGRQMRGKVRILPLNPAQCFPEFHPHDRTRLIRFKLKYRFWGTDSAGTRQVYTYTELITETTIEEYVNDQQIDARPNPLGRIPVVHMPNLSLSSSPWGLSDIGDIIGLNREYNEKATDVSDIINYYAAPVTVITGAKASQLERGAKKVWGGLPKDAKVFNLESANREIIAGPLEYMDRVKTAMHELVGVPVQAFGQEQQISNTSGVALSMQYQSAMMRYSQKLQQAGPALEAVNELILLTLFMFEPETVLYDPILSEGVEPTSDQLIVLDPNDAISLQTECDWPSPLPLDLLIKLNEILGRMAIGLMSKKRALKELGEDMPDQVLQELFEEMLEDNLRQGALDLQKMEIAIAQQIQTGMAIDPETGMANMIMTEGKNPETGAPEPVLPGPVLSPDPEVEGTALRLNNLAYGTKLPQVRNPASQD
jgi:hypothetical protein